MKHNKEKFSKKKIEGTSIRFFCNINIKKQMAVDFLLLKEFLEQTAFAIVDLAIQDSLFFTAIVWSYIIIILLLFFVFSTNTATRDIADN